MLSKDHIQLSMLSAFLPVIFFMYWITLDETLTMGGISTTIGGIIAILVGIFIGSILPDTDLETSKIDSMYKYKVSTNGLNKKEKFVINGLALLLGIFTFIIGKFTKHILNPVVSLLFSILMRKHINRNHRGITHSVFGIFVNCLLIGLIVVGIRQFFEFPIVFLGLVPGIFIGEILHVTEDSCTVSGTSPLYPVWGEKKLAGTIKTGDEHDNRPFIYAILLLCFDAPIVIAVWYWQITSYRLYFVLSLFSVLTAWGVIFLASRVKIKEND